MSEIKPMCEHDVERLILRIVSMWTIGYGGADDKYDEPKNTIFPSNRMPTTMARSLLYDLMHARHTHETSKEASQ